MPYPQLPAATKREARTAFVVAGVILIPMVLVAGLWLHAQNAKRMTSPPRTVDVSHFQPMNQPPTSPLYYDHK